VPGGIITGLGAAAALAASAVRHAGWWVEWHARIGPQAGCRKLADVELPPEARPCESS
jgi:hypothetical protein